MLCRPWLACLFAPALLMAQHPRHDGKTPGPAADPARTQLPPPQHAPQPILPPATALAWLRAAHARPRPTGTHAPGADPVPARPPAAGRYVTAVLVCADADVDVPRLLGLPARDVLLFSTPGGFADAEIAAALERAATVERLSLCLLLTHRDCASLAAKANTPATQALARRAAATHEFAASRRLPLEQAQALRQRELLLSLSEPLRALANEDRLRLVPASVDARTQDITWHTTRAEELPLAPVK